VYISELEPTKVFGYFYELNQIPRGSSKEKAVSDYVANFARKLNLKVNQDKYHNLIISKPATPGFEKKEPIMLQAHLDMVCEKNADTVHDFEKDPINMYIDGDLLKAQGTTLGADNGIGVAYCMALLSECNAHPPLEIVLTAEEESGMGGAENLDMSGVKARRMLNLDSSDEKMFIMGCAAGTMIDYRLPVKRETAAAGSVALNISVKGLTGGHSGADIHRERGNALCILGHLLGAVNERTDTNVVSVSGGMKVNAIPREASAVVVVQGEALADANAALASCRDDLLEKFKATDAGLSLTWENGKADANVMSRTCTDNLVASLLLMPAGVIAMSMELPGLVNSSNNLGFVETHQEYIKIGAMARGGHKLYTRQTETQVAALARVTGAEANFTGRSPAWPYDPNSALHKQAVEAYKDVFGVEPKTNAIHAGLECGIFAEKIQGLDIIAFGPDIHDLHTPDERVSISSVKRVWEFLLKLMETL